MELWVRSQDKETLMLANYFEIEQRDENFLIMARNGDPYFDQCLGLYKTKERALEVLDEIQNILKPRIITKLRNELKYNEDKELKTVYIPFYTVENTEVQELSTYVYEMPEK